VGVFADLGRAGGAFHLFLSYARLEIFKMLLTSFFPLMVPHHRCAGLDRDGTGNANRSSSHGDHELLAAAHRRLYLSVVKESKFDGQDVGNGLLAVCASAIFSAAFALVGRSWSRPGC
jgi:hypothetical protein